MKNVSIKMSMYAAAAFVLSVGSGFAQQPGTVSVKVPFEFTAGTTTMPAGEYNIHESNNGIVLISSAELHKAVMVLTNAQGTSQGPAQSNVTFEKVGNQYSLSEVNLLGAPGRKLVHLEQPEGSTKMTAKLGVTNASSKGLKK